jgi:broad specificity phosphatase PhoE
MVVLLALGLQAVAAARPAPTLAQDGGLTVDELRQGGYVIFFRHVTADDGVDQAGLDVNNCAQQRNIREPGLRDARTIGNAFRLLDIPIGTVYSSEYCRARETAAIAFGEHVIVPALDLCCADTNPIPNDERLRHVEHAVAQLPPAGRNTVIVAHGVGIVADLAQGEAAIYKPDGQGRTVRVARVLPDEWMGGVYLPGGARQ